MIKDPIVDEIHAIREELSREAGDDIYRIAKAARRRQQASAGDHEVVNHPPRCVPSTKKAS